MALKIRNQSLFSLFALRQVRDEHCCVCYTFCLLRIRSEDICILKVYLPSAVWTVKCDITADTYSCTEIKLLREPVPKVNAAFLGNNNEFKVRFDGTSNVYLAKLTRYSMFTRNLVCPTLRCIVKVKYLQLTVRGTSMIVFVRHLLERSSVSTTILRSCISWFTLIFTYGQTILKVIFLGVLRIVLGCRYHKRVLSACVPHNISSFKINLYEWCSMKSAVIAETVLIVYLGKASGTRQYI